MPFGKELIQITKDLRIALPTITGKPTSSYPEDSRYMIEVHVPGRTFEPRTERVDFKFIAPNWILGRDMAVHYALGRIKEVYRGCPISPDLFTVSRRREDGEIISSKTKDALLSYAQTLEKHNGTLEHRVIKDARKIKQLSLHELELEEAAPEAHYEHELELEAEIWIQNMENHFGSNLISRKYEVEHVLQYFTQSAAIWWKMHHAIQGFSGAETWDEFKKTLLRSRLIQKCYDNPKEKTCACKIYGEIGHTQEEHTDGCTHCEENHPAEECPSSQVTCFLYEGTTHYPDQCHIYPKVQQVVKQQKDAVKETLKKKILEEPVMNEYIEDPDGQGLTRFFSNACYSCEEEGHYSQDCTKRSQEYLGYFPTEEVEFDPLEIEELAKRRSPKRRKSTLGRTKSLQTKT
ncbi:hypothetical protein D1007_50046 [Hordeum vulgare]|nr:hypothetical protein D1007_50046 [Hordeum vulgare]